MKKTETKRLVIWTLVLLIIDIVILNFFHNSYNGSSFDLLNMIIPGIPGVSTSFVETEEADWPYLDNLMQIQFTYGATSYLENELGIFSPANAFDNDSSTAWVENVEGYGKGERISLQYLGATPVEVIGFNFMIGYDASMEHFNSYSNPIRIKVTSTSGGEASIKLKNSPNPQIAYLNDRFILYPGDTIIFSIESVQPGVNDIAQSTAISEIRVLF